MSSTTHPFAAPCQPFFYGLASVPAGSVTFGSINLHEFAVDLQQATMTFPSARASLQQEQVSNLDADAVESALSISGSFGLTEVGGTRRSLAGRQRSQLTDGGDRWGDTQRSRFDGAEGADRLL